jgi:hypothetical protein
MDGRQNAIDRAMDAAIAQRMNAENGVRRAPRPIRVADILDSMVLHPLFPSALHCDV